MAGYLGILIGKEGKSFLSIKGELKFCFKYIIIIYNT